MFLSSHLIDKVSKEVLGNQGDADVRSNSEVKCWESDPKFCHAFVLDGFSHCVENVLVWELSICIFLHLLNLGLGVVEW